MKQLEERQGVAGFCFLEVPDEMPAQSRGQEGNFDARFLHPAFAKEQLACFDGGLHFLGSVRLRTATSSIWSAVRPLFLAASEMRSWSCASLVAISSIGEAFTLGGGERAFSRRFFA